jgi:hypothetical protein
LSRPLRALGSGLSVALLLLAGCGGSDRAGGEPTAGVAEAAASPAAAPSPDPSAAAPDLLLDTVWVRQDPAAPPGDLRIFLADGTLVIDSCWEVYALRRWRRAGPDGLVMEEDVEVPARILALGPDELRLELSLVGGERQEVAYRRAQVPYVCPGMAR